MHRVDAAPRSVALVVAAGRGHRAGGAIPKQYRLVAGRPILRVTLEALLAGPALGEVRVVIHPDDVPLYLLAVDGLDDPRLGGWIAGGATRQESVRLGLEALASAGPDHVLVHDAVRPFVKPEVIAATLAALADAPGAIAALPVSDTLKRAEAAGQIAGTVDRGSLYAAQTPQAFRFDALLRAHRAAAEQKREDFTDDAALLEWRGETVRLVPGSADNFKITTAEDFARAERRLATLRETRTGIGYDVHAFGPGDHVMLGGVRIAHECGVVAHSDGDVVLHALTDALLGALGEGDIGQHFPPSDAKWRGASSDRFLAFAAERVTRRGGAILHLDVAVVAEAPRVGPHREAMRAEIARVAGIEGGRVSIKATTSEKLGFTGRREGLAALAIATVALP